MRLRGSVEKRLVEIRSELRRFQEALRVLDEQVAFQRSVAEEAETRALVSGTPLADRERHQAVGDLHRLRRQREETAAEVERLRAEQDRLLEQLLEAGG